MRLPSLKVICYEYVRYAEEQLLKLERKYGQIDRGSDIGLKLDHGVSMAQAVQTTAMGTGFFNDSYKDSFAIDGALHDVGRFQQFYLTGKLNDGDLVTYMREKGLIVPDHGALGRLLLLENGCTLLRRFLPACRYTKSYDQIVTEVVGEHTQIQNPRYRDPLAELQTCFRNYSLDEIVTSKDEKMKDQLISAKITLVQECDSLELLEKAAGGSWKPEISSELTKHCSNIVFDKMMNFEPISIPEMRTSGNWTCNGGFVFRDGLMLLKFNLVATLKYIVEKGLIDQLLHQATYLCKDDLGNHALMTDSRLNEATEYTKLAVANLIATSEDGIFITPNSREQAKQKTLKMWN